MNVDPTVSPFWGYTRLLLSLPFEALLIAGALAEMMVRTGYYFLITTLVALIGGVAGIYATIFCPWAFKTGRHTLLERVGIFFTAPSYVVYHYASDRFGEKPGLVQLIFFNVLCWMIYIGSVIFLL